MATNNQNPEQFTRDIIDSALERSGWVIQNKKQCNLAAGVRVGIRKFQTGAGAAESILFVNQKPVGLIEARQEEEGVRLTTHEEQSVDYANAKLKYINNDPLPFVYGSTSKNVPKTESRLSVCDKIEETITDSLKQAEALRKVF